MKHTSTLTPERLKTWRLSHQWKPSMAADRLGVGGSTYYQYEEGRAPISLLVAYACAAIDAGIEPLS